MPIEVAADWSCEIDLLSHPKLIIKKPITTDIFVRIIDFIFTKIGVTTNFANQAL
jgi:hypothetical protein